MPSSPRHEPPVNPESAARVARLQAGMATEDLDALLLTEPTNVRYVTGGYAADVLWSSPTRILAAIVPRDGDPAHFVEFDLLSRVLHRVVTADEADLEPGQCSQEFRHV